MSKIKNDLLKQILNLYWLRPEVGPECTFRSISLDGLNFESPSIDISMMRPLIIMTIALTLIGLTIAIIRIKAEILERKLKN